jgi:hypothetical protein
MAEIIRLVVNWTGFTGGPGYTNLHFRDFTAGGVDQAMVDGAIAKTDTWLDTFVPIVPTVASFTINPAVEVIEETTGALQSYMTGTPDATRVGTSAGVYVGGTGACVNWYTNVVRNSRRVRGRTFIVPLGLQAMTNDGTIDDTRLTAMRAATATFIDPTGAGDLGVWARPTTPGGSDGEWAVCTAFTINDKMAQLRSRRD